MRRRSLSVLFGDKACAFDPNLVALLDEAGDVLRRRGTKVQRLRLTGGTCEATAYLTFGLEAADALGRHGDAFIRLAFPVTVAYGAAALAAAAVLARRLRGRSGRELLGAINAAVAVATAAFELALLLGDKSPELPAPLPIILGSFECSI